MKKDKIKAQGWTTANGTVDIYLMKIKGDSKTRQEVEDILKEQHAKKSLTSLKLDQILYMINPDVLEKLEKKKMNEKQKFYKSAKVFKNYKGDLPPNLI